MLRWFVAVMVLVFSFLLGNLLDFFFQQRILLRHLDIVIVNADIRRQGEWKGQRQYQL